MVDVEVIHAAAAVEAVVEVEGGLMEVVAEAEVDSTMGEEEDEVEAIHPEAALPAVVEEVAGDLRRLLFLGKFVPSYTTTVLM